MGFIVNINGTITPHDQAHISVMDRGFLYGDSVYEVIRTYDGKPFALDAHLERLSHSAGSLAIHIPKREALKEAVARTLNAADNEDSYVRIIITRGSGPLTLDPTTATDPVLLIMVKPYTSFPDWMYEKGIRLAIPRIRRTSRETLDPGIKSGNYLNSVIAFKEARELGFDDAIMLDNQGLVTEGTSSNVFMWTGEVLITPPLDTGLLAGVTRRLVIEIANDNDIPCEERPITVEMLAAAREVMLTSTLREVMSAVEIGEHTICDGTPGPISATLRKLFHTYAMASVALQG